jgi:hypothetical protein
VTNTSSLRPSDICAKLKNKGNFGGLHFYNPVEQKRFLEVCFSLKGINLKTERPSSDTNGYVTGSRATPRVEALSAPHSDIKKILRKI